MEHSMIITKYPSDISRPHAREHTRKPHNSIILEVETYFGMSARVNVCVCVGLVVIRIICITIFDRSATIKLIPYYWMSSSAARNQSKSVYREHQAHIAQTHINTLHRPQKTRNANVLLLALEMQYVSDELRTTCLCTLGWLCGNMLPFICVCFCVLESAIAFHYIRTTIIHLNPYDSYCCRLDNCSLHLSIQAMHTMHIAHGTHTHNDEWNM